MPHKFLVLTEEKYKNYSAYFLNTFDTFKEAIQNSYNQDIKNQEVELSDKNHIDINFNEKVLSSIFIDYDRLAHCIKIDMKQSPIDNIDRHKIAAIMIISILKNKNIVEVNTVFKVKDRKTLYSTIEIPYIYYAVFIAINIMEQMMKKENTSQEDISFNVYTEYIDELVKMLYKNQPVLCEPLDRVSCHETMNLVYCLSNLLYLLEQYSIITK